MIKAKQTLKKDTRFLDKSVPIFEVKLMNFLLTLYKNHTKPPVILGFSYTDPIMILLASSQKFYRYFYIVILLDITSHILFAYILCIHFMQLKIKFWAKSWVNLKKVLSLFFISFEYTVIQLYRLFISHNFHQ